MGLGNFLGGGGTFLLGPKGMSPVRERPDKPSRLPETPFFLFWRANEYSTNSSGWVSVVGKKASHDQVGFELGTLRATELRATTRPQWMITPHGRVVDMFFFWPPHARQVQDQ